MLSKRRVFFALVLPEEIKKYLHQLRNQWDKNYKNIRWTSEENYHITLHFFGDIETSELLRISQLAKEPGLPIAAFETQVEGIGYFPNEKAARILWAGIAQEGDQKVNLLYECLRLRIQKAGFPVEDRPFHAHITLGRSLPHQSICQTYPHKAEEEIRSTPARITHFAIFESRLRHDRANYEILETFPLQG